MKTPAAQIARLFDFPVDAGLEMRARFNIAPTQPVAAVRAAPTGGRELVFLRWGLVPSWATDLKIGASLINARGETISSKPSFRSAFRRRRCLIPADSFYEWQKGPSTGRKQPYSISVAGGGPFALAGLWEHWAKGDAEPVESCTIVTTGANALLRPLHDRMPVIVRPEDFAAWLDPEANVPDLESLVKAYPAEQMEMHAVSTHVNSVRNDDPHCLDPAPAPEPAPPRPSAPERQPPSAARSLFDDEAP